MANVFDYLDYRDFLGAWYKEAKDAKRNISYRTLAAQVGFKSAGFFTQILQGKSNISLNTAEGFAEVVDLKGRPREYFLALVAWNQAKDPESSLQARKRLERFREFQMSKLRLEQGEFMRHWHHGAIRELLGICPTRDGWERLGNLLQPPIPAPQVRESVDVLLRLGLAVRTANGIERKDTALSTGIQPNLEETREYYLQMLELARQALDSFPREERNLSWVTLSVSETSRQEIVEELRAFRKRLVEIAARDPHPTRVHQVNLQFFPLSHTIPVGAR
jgi:uncharacterized protein (TIGR02147 family)